MLHKKSETKEALIEKNTYHQKKVLSTQAYKDKVYNKLLDDGAQDKIPNSKLCPDYCTNRDVCKFLTLLKHLNSQNK